MSTPSPLRAPGPPRRRSASPALVACGALAALAIGCGNGSLGDQPTKVTPNEYGQSTRLCDILGPATWEMGAGPIDCPVGCAGCAQCATVPPNQSVVVTGVTVVAIDTFDETMDGKSVGDIYVEDTRCDGKPYSGIQVFEPGYSPPALRPAAGDVLDLNGLYEEFRGPTDSTECEIFPSCRTLPEFTGTLAFRFDSVGLPAPVDITDVDITTYDGGRPYLGMLVRMQNVTLASAGATDDGRYTANIVGGQIPLPQIANELYDIQGQGPALAAGMTFASVTGILTYFYDFQIAPRSPADFVLTSADGGAGDGGM